MSLSRKLIDELEDHVMMNTVETTGNQLPETKYFLYSITVSIVPERTAEKPPAAGRVFLLPNAVGNTILQGANLQ